MSTEAKDLAFAQWIKNVKWFLKDYPHLQALVNDGRVLHEDMDEEEFAEIARALLDIMSKCYEKNTEWTNARKLFVEGYSMFFELPFWSRGNIEESAEHFIAIWGGSNASRRLMTNIVNAVA